MQIPFVGGSYEGRSKNINAQRSVNLYPILDNQHGKVPIAMYGTPGFKAFATTGTHSGIRGMLVAGSYLYAVAYDKLYRVDTSGTATSLGSIDSTSGKCWIEYNGTTGNQVMVVDGTTGYVYNTSTGAFAKIADADFPGASSLTFQDGYFIVTKPNTAQFWVSGSYNGTSWTSTAFATAEGQVDNLMSCLSDHRELWLFGSKSTEIWYNVGTGTPPFERKVDEVMERGCIAAGSPTKLDNTVYWLDENGMAIRADGYKPSIVSTRQIEYQWSTYTSISDALGFSYIMEGHTFWVLTFPTANKTWVYDASTGFWHERESIYSHSAGRWRASCYAYFNGKHLIGDHSLPYIYELDLDLYEEGDNELKCVRACPVIHEDQKLLFHHALEIEFEAGVGGEQVKAENPKAMLKWSDDGGHTWSNEHWADIGKMGEYGKRAIWRRLGRSRNRVYEVTITDPVKRVIMGANLTASKGNA